MEPFYNATTIFSGSNYPTLNLIYLTMTLLIKEFAPSDEETEDDYIELLFEPLEQEESQMNDQSQIIDNNSDIDNEIEPMITKEQLQQPLQIIASPITTEGLHNLVKAASYLSLQEYWKVPEDVELIAAFLDPQIKSLKFLGNTTLKITTINKVRRLCVEEECRQPSIEEFSRNKSFNISTSEIVTSNDLMAALYRDEESDNEDFEENELDLPATSVPSERLFSDAGLYITALRNWLQPDMVEKMIFLKRNMQFFPIFKPDEV
ncbi:11357_t:CDS:2 [Ambispora gerdemannii]|uniref:11357_t:CDS:1 n=1 Tax=Ambispora gerdemannii TaxID=144530 RepID=A0A9N9AWC1_9GLOM|nr:11357_t:CDS:2 [Ambispora gerdemannii]